MILAGHSVADGHFVNQYLSQPVKEAYAYNIYYGIAPDKLYNSITVLGDTMYDFRGLDKDTDYYFSIEALGESGRSPMSKVLRR